MAKNTKSPANAPHTVTVGCKLPNGLILELGNRTVEINGANSTRVIGGYGITPNVDAGFFAAWLKAHAGRDMVKKGFIFAHGKPEDTKAQAKEQADNRSGLEAVSPDAPENGVSTAKE